MKHTKIVCTIGPASDSISKITRLVKSGLNITRLNFSHGDYSSHTKLISNIRTVSKKLNKPIGILQDLQGPRIRTGNIVKAGIKLKSGDTIVLVPESFKVSFKDSSNLIPIQYAGLYKDVKPGDPILIDDAKIELRVVAIKNKAIECKVKIGDLLTARRGMNFPKSQISTPAITKKDKEDLKFGLYQGVDFVSLSFVKEAGDIIKLRQMIKTHETRLSRTRKHLKKPTQLSTWTGTHTKIIAKIERPEAIENFEEILEAVDGIMIARGDLGMEIPIHKMPLIQKKIIKRCIQESKPVIVATQMLDSMIRFPLPTRAEVTDVANAILDGTDGIMLSGETATGKYPHKAVKMMTNIANQVEKREIEHYQKIEKELKNKGGITESVSYGAQNIAEKINAKLIVCATVSGLTARAVSKYRTGIPMVAMTATEMTRNQLCLSWGVSPYHIKFASSFTQLMSLIKKTLLDRKLVTKGDVIVVAASHPIGHLGQTNLVKVVTI